MLLVVVQMMVKHVPRFKTTRQYTIKNNDKRVASARPTYLVTRHGGANTVNLILDGSCECRIHRHPTQCQQELPIVSLNQFVWS